MATEKEKMLRGALYRANDPELTQERERTRVLLHRLNVTDYGDREARRAVLRELLPQCPSDLWIEPPFHCDYGSNIRCGEQVYFNFDCVILDVCPVTIGSHVFFGPKVQLYTATHPLDWRQRREELENGAAIVIEDDCWIGGGAIILPGVTVGARSVIGAGAVVTRDVPADSVAVGNPAGIRSG